MNVVKLIEYFDEHFYALQMEDGNREYFPSVTTKLRAAPKPFLSRWRGDLGNREADFRMYDAANKGKRIHYAVGVFLNDGVVLYNPFNHPNYKPEEIKEIQSKIGQEVFILQDQEEMLHVVRFQEWIKRTNAKVVATDMIVYDLKNKEAGTLDFVFDIEAGAYDVNGSKLLKLEKGLYVGDLKSGNEVYDDANMQVAAYSKMYFINGEFPTNFKGAMIIHTGAKTKNGIPGLSTVMRSLEEINADYMDFRHVAAVWNRGNKNAMPRILEFPGMVTKNEAFIEKKEN